MSVAIRSAKPTVQISAEELQNFNKMRKEHNLEQYTAYKKAKELYKKVLLQLEDPGNLKGDKITDEQALAIFQLYKKAKELDLQCCYNLTGKSLQLLPAGLERLFTPYKTEYDDLRNLPNNLKYLFVYYIQKKETIGGFNLKNIQLVELHIPGPTKEVFGFMQLLPTTLEVCVIDGGELDSIDVAIFIKSATKLRQLTLNRVFKVNYLAFAPTTIPPALKRICLFECPGMNFDELEHIIDLGIKIEIIRDKKRKIPDVV